MILQLTPPITLYYDNRTETRQEKMLRNAGDLSAIIEQHRIQVSREKEREREGLFVFEVESIWSKERGR